MSTLTLLLIVIGVVFLVSELVLPGGVVMWLGVSSLIVAGLTHLGYLQNWTSVFISWSFLSASMVVTSLFCLKMYLDKDVVRKDYDQDRDLMGSLVEVETKVTTENHAGRIRFQGTSWEARSVAGEIAATQRAVIVGRDNLTWLVQPYELPESPSESELSDSQ